MGRLRIAFRQPGRVGLTVATILLFLPIGVAMISLALRSAQLGSISTYLSQTPVVPPQAALAACFVLLALALLARLIRPLCGEAPEKPTLEAIE